jgi:hypothetical protein
MNWDRIDEGRGQEAQLRFAAECERDAWVQ